MKEAVSPVCIQNRRGSEPAIPVRVSGNVLRGLEYIVCIQLYPIVSKVLSFLFRSYITMSPYIGGKGGTVNSTHSGLSSGKDWLPCPWKGRSCSRCYRWKLVKTLLGCSSVA